jgi:uncharacterized protein (DUF924 family)
MRPAEVLDFWFSERVQRLCFERDTAFDSEIREKFGAAVAAAQDGGFEEWRATPEGALALVILIDQMSRNIFRGSPQAFAGDTRALAIAEAIVASGADRRFTFTQRRFTYLPFEHSEDPKVQKKALRCSAPSPPIAPRSTMSMPRCSCSMPPGMPRSSSASAAIRTATCAWGGSRRRRKRRS